MAECPFCSIIANESTGHRITETEQTLAFLDIEPVARGHTLVVPKTHHVTLTEMPEALAGRVFRTAHRVADALESAYEIDGVNLVQSNGSAAGQEVRHAHVHVIPREEDDSVNLGWESDPSVREQSENVTATLRAAIPDT